MLAASYMTSKTHFMRLTGGVLDKETAEAIDAALGGLSETRH